MKQVFIDGQVGTTGLQIKERLEARADIKLVTIEEELRKDAARKKEIINSVDLVILCLPDGPAKESASLLENSTTRIIDASTAHRVDPHWVYGFPELSKEYRLKVANAQLVSNPGCHATGFIAGIYPLIKEGILPQDALLTSTSLTGYSGGGKQLIADFDAIEGDRSPYACRPYGFNMAHKHLPEMSVVTGLDTKPIFYPVVGDFERGMLVSMPLFPQSFSKKMSVKEVHAFFAEYYKDEQFINVKDFYCEADLEGPFLNATKCNDTNRLDLFVYGHEDQIMVVSRLDNLGKGASGAAVQNMNIMLGLDEATGLSL